MLDVKDTAGSFCLHGVQGLMRKMDKETSKYKITTVLSTMKKRSTVPQEYMSLSAKVMAEH